MKSVMQHSFAEIQQGKIPRSSFNRSHGYKTTFDAGLLVPIYIDEAVPGDTHKLRLNAFARMATPLFPVMDNAFMDFFFFAVPYRLVWDNFQKMQGEQIDPGDSIDYTIPQMVSPGGGYLPLTLEDYFGLPTAVAGMTHSCLWHRAYYKIWNDWFRDQNLQDSLTVPRTDGPDTAGSYVLQRRGKRHDYFTSSLPTPQRGDAITLPLGTKAPVTTDVATDGFVSVYSSANTQYQALYESGTIGLKLRSTVGTEAQQLYADLESATAATINALRLSVALQELVERDMRGGTRYPEIIRAHFGVISPDHRLQRPELLGGGSVPINVTPIAQTSEDGTTKLGSLGAMGTVRVNGSIGFTKSFTEHCLLIGLCSVRADLTYQQGLDRMWTRSTRYDHYLPGLAHLGEMAVLNKEIYADGSANDDLVWGYQEHWGDMKMKTSKITGQFRSNHATSLDSWHLSEDYASRPVLNASWIEVDPPFDRVIKTPAEPHFIYDSFVDLVSVRPMPIYSTPALGSKL